MDRYAIATTRGAVRLHRQWARDPNTNPTAGGGGTNDGRPRPYPNAPIGARFDRRARGRLRWALGAMAWEDLGPRPAMVTLTYPGNWQAIAPNGTVSGAQFRKLRERWARRWDERMRGVWVREFQERGAPHFHMYVGLPPGVSDDEHERLTRRVVTRQSLERKIGKHLARRACGFPDREFGIWLRKSWAACCGTTGTMHENMGADVAPMFRGAGLEDALAGRVDWAKLSEYLWRESGKWGQKEAPPGFEPVGRWWASMGVELQVREDTISAAKFTEVKRVLRGWWKAQGLEWKVRGRDGFTVHNAEIARRADELRDWARDTVAWKDFAEAERDPQAGRQAREKAAEARKAFLSPESPPLAA